GDGRCRGHDDPGPLQPGCPDMPAGGGRSWLPAHRRRGTGSAGPADQRCAEPGRAGPVGYVHARWPRGQRRGGWARRQRGGRAGWREWFAALAIMCAVLAGVVAVLAHGQDAGAPAAPRPRAHRRGEFAAPLLLACGFGALSLMTVAILALLPSYLSTQLGLSA